MILLYYYTILLKYHHIKAVLFEDYYANNSADTGNSITIIPQMYTKMYRFGGLYIN
jgi:hypothetical protein